MKYRRWKQDARKLRAEYERLCARGVNVMAFGANPSGRELSDDAIRRAIAYSLPPLRFPVGRYVVGTPIEPSAARIQGEP